MNRYLVTLYVNVSDDLFRRFGDTSRLRPTDPIALVGDFEFSATDHLSAAAAAWPVGNKVTQDLNGKRYPLDVRSLSAGDLIGVADRATGEMHFYAIEGVGHTEVVEPANRIVELSAGYGIHTSRL